MQAGEQAKKWEIDRGASLTQKGGRGDEGARNPEYFFIIGWREKGGWMEFGGGGHNPNKKAENNEQ